MSSFSKIQRLGLLILVMGASLWTTGAMAQFVGVQYGPRAFSTAPAGTSFLGIGVDSMDMNMGLDGTLISGINIRTRATTLTIGRFFDLAGKSAQVLFSVPWVSIETGVVTTCCGTFEALSEQGITDPYIQFSVALVGGDTLSPQEFVRTEPGFVMNFMAGARPAIGEYSPLSPINVGANRFEYRVALPVSYTWGTPGQQTSLEFTPVVYQFLDNNDPFGAGTVSQNPVFQIEAHVVHDFSPAFFGSLNVAQVWGGGTTTDGVANFNGVNYSSIGFTLGGRLSRQIGYGAFIARRLSSKSDLDSGYVIRLALTYSF